jgi:hypothetical protein
MASSSGGHGGGCSAAWLSICLEFLQVMASILPPHSSAAASSPVLTEFVNEHLRTENRDLKEKMEVAEEKIAFLGRQLQQLLVETEQSQVCTQHRSCPWQLCGCSMSPNGRGAEPCTVGAAVRSDCRSREPRRGLPIPLAWALPTGMSRAWSLSLTHRVLTRGGGDAPTARAGGERPAIAASAVSFHPTRRL